MSIQPIFDLTNRRSSGNIDSRYTMELLDSNGVVLAELSGKAGDRKLHFIRNGTYEATWTLDLDTFEQYCRDIGTNPASLLGIGRNQIRISRYGVTLFGGQILYYETELSDKKVLTIKALGWLDLFKDRYTSIERLFGSIDPLTTVDAGEIAWTLIDESQSLTNGDFGITQGTIMPSVGRIRLYEWKPIREALIQLTTVKDGIDFEFTPDKRFNVFYPKMGVNRTDFELRYPGNVKTFKSINDATKLLNYNVVRGQGFGEGQLIDIRQDIPSQLLYKLRQDVRDYSDIPNVTWLQDLGDEDVKNDKDPFELIEVTLDGNQEPHIGGFWLGDTVPLIIEDYITFEHINTPYRIDEITIDIDENDSEDIQLRLERPKE